MCHRLIAFLLLSGFAFVAAQTAPTRQNGAFLVRMTETELTLHPTAGPNNVGNCLVSGAGWPCSSRTSPPGVS